MTIQISDDHKDPQDCQLIVALTGSKEYIQAELFRMYAECMDRGKVSQGQIWQGGGKAHIITPMWNGNIYKG